MDFRINCPCGSHVMVTEGAADGTRQCSCGRTLAVPSLKELRLQAGLPAYNISPELMIEHLLAAGELPGSQACARCGAHTDDLILVLTRCEQSWTRRTGGFSWLTLIVSAFFLPFTIWFREEREETTYGTDK